MLRSDIDSLFSAPKYSLSKTEWPIHIYWYSHSKSTSRWRRSTAAARMRSTTKSCSSWWRSSCADTAEWCADFSWRTMSSNCWRVPIFRCKTLLATPLRNSPRTRPFQTVNPKIAVNRPSENVVWCRTHATTPSTRVMRKKMKADRASESSYASSHIEMLDDAKKQKRRIASTRRRRSGKRSE